MENYTITKEKYNDIIIKLQDPYSFDIDGCLCGSFRYQLEENLYIDIYRSCRKSSTTPSGQQWNIDGVNLVMAEIDPEWNEGDDESWKYFYEKSQFLQLNEEQSHRLLKLAELSTMKYCGYNKFGEEFDEEDYKYYTSYKEAYENDSINIDEYEVILEKDENNKLCLNDKKLSFFMNCLFEECRTIEEINWLKDELNEHVAQAHLSKEYDLENE